MTKRFPSVLVASAVAAYVALVLPLQTFLGNTSNYDYGAIRLLFELGVAAISLFAVVFVLLELSNRFIRGYLIPLLVSIAVLAYLESGPLSFGLPEINGELPVALDAFPRKLWDLAIWAFVTIAMIVTYHWSRAWLHWLSVAVLILGLSSLLDVKIDRENVSDRSQSGGGKLELAADIVDAAEYSPTRNVIMLVLDSVPASLASARLAVSPELKARFPGFTAYCNNIGMHARTRLGVPGLMTGTYYEDGQDVGVYMMSSLGTNSFLQVYRDRGDAIYCMLDFMANGFVDRPIDPNVKAAARKSRGINESTFQSVAFRDAVEIPNLSIAIVSFFRMMPFACKYPFMMYVMRHQRIKSDGLGYGREAALYAALANRPISSNPRQAMLKFQSHGVHGPMPCKTVEQSTGYCLDHLARLMDVLRERGIYDQSFIVITADHGSDYITCAENEDRKASAMLWVKPDSPAGTQPNGGRFVESQLATSHSKIAALMKRAAVGTLSSDEIGMILHTPDRLYRRYFREDHACRDWIYHEDGRVDAP